MTARGIFFDEADARSVTARLVADGYQAAFERERLASEDDDQDHPWAVVTDAPDLVLELLVEAHDGWLDLDEQERPSRPPLVLPTAPKRPGAG